MDQRADKQGHQIQRGMPSWPRSRARKLGAFPFPINAGEGPATAAAGERLCPPPNTGPGAEDDRRRPEPCGAVLANQGKP